ncbi:hypothetical protein [Caudoviricetes sp.]|nr:hypothetical protein [Caudoviricetes sp.]
MNEGKFKVGAFLIFVLIALFVLFMSTSARAAPFAVGCVPASASAADKYVVSGATHAALNGEFDLIVDAVNCPGAGVRAARIDLAGTPEGVNSLNIALKSDLWGVLGAPSPFSFPRPSAATLVFGSIQLSKQ